MEERECIGECKEDLLVAQKQLQNRLQYDAISAEILSIRSREDLSRSIKEVEDEIGDILRKIEAHDETIKARNEVCHGVLRSIQELIEVVGADMKADN